MSKQVILGKCLETGRKRVFLTLEEASDELGTSIASASRACMGGEPCRGWSLRRVDRVYAVRLKAFNSWRVVVQNGKNSGYLEYGNPLSKVRKCDVADVRDITESWYL